MNESQERLESHTAAKVGLVLGPLLAIGIGLLPPSLIGTLSSDGQWTASVAAWMAVWWMTEAVPLPVTSLLPIVMFPLLDIVSLEEAATPYANQYIFLFLGGFMLARAVERWHLHRRIALVTVLAVGTSPRRLIGGFMLATAALSMWISNTASTVMMLPIGLSLVALLDEQLAAASPDSQPVQANFATALMLGIAYAASIGGLATLVGTPTNLLLAGFATENGISIGFAQWMKFALPLSILFLVLTWFLLTYWIFPIRVNKIEGGRQVIRDALQRMGSMSRGERIVSVVFVGTALSWVFREPLTNWEALTTLVPLAARLNDTVIALIAATLLFVLPVDWKQHRFVLDWDTAVTLPWGVLLLFGGGFSLAAAIKSSGLADWIGGQVTTMTDLPMWALVVVIAAMVVFLTELTSNTPTAAAFLPILYGVALAAGIAPLWFLVPATLAATCAFMLPVATPPNAIVFGSGRVSIRSMVHAGIWLNLVSIVAISAWIYLWGPLVFDLPR